MRAALVKRPYLSTTSILSRKLQKRPCTQTERNFDWSSAYIDRWAANQRMPPGLMRYVIWGRRMRYVRLNYEDAQKSNPIRMWGPRHSNSALLFTHVHISTRIIWTMQYNAIAQSKPTRIVLFDMSVVKFRSIALQQAAPQSSMPPLTRNKSGPWRQGSRRIQPSSFQHGAHGRRRS